MTPSAPRVAIFAFAVLAPLAAWAETSQPLPTPFPEARYQRMSARSPFAIATAAAAATAAPTPGFAAQLYVDGVARIGQKDFVAIKSRDPDKQSVIFLEVGKSTDDGMKVDGVRWSSETGKSTVDVSKDGEKATLIFDEQQMAKPAPAVPAMLPGRPGFRMPVLPSQGRPVQNGSYPPGSQFNRPQILQQQQQGQAAPGAQNGVEMRRRVRIIQSGQ